MLTREEIEKALRLPVIEGPAVDHKKLMHTIPTRHLRYVDESKYIQLAKTALLAHDFRDALERVLDCKECKGAGTVPLDLSKFKGSYPECDRIECSCRFEARKLLQALSKAEGEEEK